MIFPWRVVIIVPAVSFAVAEEAARAINSTGPSYDGHAFSLPLSASGGATATHYGLYTSATDEMVAAMGSVLPNVGGAMYWRHNLDGVLVASNVTDAHGQAWGWQQSLEASGLGVVSAAMS